MKDGHGIARYNTTSSDLPHYHQTQFYLMYYIIGKWFIVSDLKNPRKRELVALRVRKRRHLL